MSDRAAILANIQRAAENELQNERQAGAAAASDDVLRSYRDDSAKNLSDVEDSNRLVEDSNRLPERDLEARLAVAGRPARVAQTPTARAVAPSGQRAVAPSVSPAAHAPTQHRMRNQTRGIAGIMMDTARH